MFLDPEQDFHSIINEMQFDFLISVRNVNSRSTEILNREPDKSLTIFDLVVDMYCVQSKNIHNRICSEQPSFIASTSGSTGNPKLIQVPIQCLQPNIDDLTKIFQITPSDVIYFSTPLTFDPSMVEILLAITNGASLLIAPEKSCLLFPEDLENSITVWQTTPSKFFQLSNTEIMNRILSANSTLRILALGGEPLIGVKRLKELKHEDNRTKIYALYGVTEMSCWATVAELDLNKIANDAEVPLGDCLSETNISIKTLEKEKNKGNIVLISKTRKCIIFNRNTGNEEVNSLKFLDTNDVGEQKNGTIYYRGRRDDIIKRFGHKINLQSIESTIMLCPRVNSCSCVWLPKPMLLITYFSSDTLNSQELGDFLKCKLDDKCWPDKIVRVDNLPINPHGKVSRKLLAQMFEKLSPLKQSVKNLKNVLLKELKVTLNRNFTYDEVKDMDFYAIGGTSFLAMSMCNKISLTSPQFGKLILPYLLSQRHTIDEIVQLASKELDVESHKPRKRLRRTKSISNESNTLSRTQTTNKSVVGVSSPVEFMVVWTYDTGKCVDCSPTLFQHEFTLYVTAGSHSGKVVVCDAISGFTRGVIKVKSRIEAPVFCTAEAPSTVPCGIVGAYDGTVLCFTLEECKELWRANIGCMIKSKVTCCNGVLFVAAYDGNVRCLDIKTGEILHSIQVSDQAISADLVLAKSEYVLLGTLSGVCASIHTQTRTVVWRGTLSSPVFASPALYDNDKYVVFAEVNGEIHCRTVEKGIKIWKYQGARGNIFSSIHIREVETYKWQMIFGCHDSHVYSIIVKNFQPCLTWKTQLPSAVYSTPSRISDKLVVAASNNGVLSILEVDTGTVIADFALPNETFSSPAVYGDYIFIGCRNDHIYGIKYVLNF
ncbi:beta-alanine-activating enzyme isoform X2 [Leptidea sinapis]|nr:beta-alanine-activating enzyme isoform X2 [Leptidea sinapis]XP_050679937.1 beta-alanine-activating enzyme isoform X2 [Leptidea sinapis]